MNSGDATTEKEAKQERKNEKKGIYLQSLENTRGAHQDSSHLWVNGSKRILSSSSLADGGQGSKKKKKLKAFTPVLVCDDREQDRSDSIMRPT